MKTQAALELFLRYRSTSVSPTTLYTDTSILMQFAAWLGDVDMKNVTSDTIRNYIQHERNRGLGNYTIRRARASLSAAWSWFLDPNVELATTHIVSPVKAPPKPKTKPRAISMDNVEKLIEVSKQSDYPRRARALLLFFVDTGCRVSEVCGIQMDDVEFKDGRVRVRADVSKGNKERYTYLGNRSLVALGIYVQEERPEPMILGDDSLFLTEDGTPWNRYGLYQVITRFGENAGIKVSPHMFRHTGAIERLRNGMDILSLKEMWGHADLETTRQYLSALNDEDIWRKASRTSPSDRRKL